MITANFSEVCPHCDCVNDRENHDVTNGYVIRCQDCGEQIFLCDVCMHAPDNKEQHCDWHIARQSEHYCVGKCFRGVTFNRLA